MMQCGGGNNMSMALLKEFFGHEKRSEEHFRKQLSGSKSMAAQVRKGNTTGVLPIITSNTDTASLRRGTGARARKPGGQFSSPRSRTASHSPRSHTSSSSIGHHYSGHVSSSARQRGEQLNSPPPFDLRNQGIGAGVPQPPSSPRRTELMIEERLKKPSHGRGPPYGRRAGMKEFLDDISGAGIACLHPAMTEQSLVGGAHH